MSQSNKRSKSKIFIIIFALVAIVVTGFLIWYTLINNSNTETDTETTDVFYISTEKTSEGLSTYDTYDENAITIEEIEDEIDEVTVSYVQIDGLIDEEIENKINQEIKDLAYGYDAEKTVEYCNFYITANYANVLSIEGYYEYTEGEDEDYVEETKTLNYDLTTGEQIEFYDLFVSESAGLSVVRDSAYIDLADVYSNEARTDEWNMYEPDMSTIDYGEIEEDLNYVVLCYRKKKIERFCFSEQTIYFWIDDGNGESEAYSINMVDFLENIAIYNRYSTVSSEEIYEDTSISRKDLLVLTYNMETIYEIKEEKDNYYIDIYMYDWEDIIDEDYEDYITMLKQKMEEKATELREIAEGSDKFYIFNCEFSYESQITYDDETGGVVTKLVTTEYSKEYTCETEDWSLIKDAMIEYWRDTNDAEAHPTTSCDGIESNEDLEDLYSYSESEETFSYENELILTDEEAEEKLSYYTQYLVKYESFFETEEDENGNLEITNFWELSDIFSGNRIWNL